MSELALDREREGDLEVEVMPNRSGLSGRRLVFYVLLPLLFIAGIAVIFYLYKPLDQLFDKQETESSETAGVGDTYHQLPELLVNLNGEDGDGGYLKLSISLQVSGETALARIEEVQPRIVDNFQVYLRELRKEDLQGSAGIQRLREELLSRVNLAMHPTVVEDVLFREILVQ